MSDDGLDGLEPYQQAVYINHHYSGMGAPEKYVFLVAVLYDPITLGQLAEITGYTLQTARNHVRTWVNLGALDLLGTSKDSAVTFPGIRAWMNHDPKAQPQGGADG